MKEVTIDYRSAVVSMVANDNNVHNYLLGIHDHLVISAIVSDMTKTNRHSRDESRKLD